ncbi:hypothetical protein [Streptomyces cavernae]|uniref:hypothetical protein n=1 Tax=Streptomyces cavernae TaxID=2259034 RepID=UPI000FEB6656|nr:hypothetical protein [Streptomyces cavernae]
MRRGLVPGLAWLLATGAAVTLSWWGVHTVLAGTVYDPPRALPISAATTGSKPSARSTVRPVTSPSAAGPTTSEPPTSGGSASPGATGTSPAGPTGQPSASPGQADTPAGRVRSYNTDGGRAVFDLRDTYATLVSATPDSNWSMQVWKTDTWIRVEFSSGADRVSVFCTWHDSAPRVEINSY